MNIRFYNVKILTMQGGLSIKEGELWVEQDRIAYLGKENPEKFRPAWDREIDGLGNLLMPGFKNAHTHSAMTFLRSYADDLPLMDWLHKKVFPMEAHLTSEDIYQLVKLAVLEYLTSGITANFDMYLTAEPIARAAEEMGFRTVLAGPLNDFTISLEQMEQDYCRYHKKDSLVSYILGFHGEYTTSRSLLEGVAALSQKYKAPVFTHNSETEAEVQSCLERTGMTPTVYLDSLGMFGYGGGGYHCVHMTPEDIAVFKKRGLCAVTNPASNLKLASGIAPVHEFLKQGICVAVGTDGPASNNCLDMFREMFLVTGLAKLREKDASAVDANEVLYMATAGGAKAMGLTECDALAEGKKADLILIDLHQPNMQPVNQITKNIVYSGSKQNVKLTMVNGKILYENGEFFVGEEAEEIYQKANRIAERIKQQM